MVKYRGRWRYKTIKSDDGRWAVCRPFGGNPEINMHVVATFYTRTEAYEYARFKNSQEAFE